MGTSSKYPGLKRARLQKAVKSAESAKPPAPLESVEAGGSWRLADAVLCELMDPDAEPDEPLQPLVAVGGEAAGRFTRVVAEVFAGERPPPETHRSLAEFVDDVTGSGESIADSIVRRAATTSAQRLAEETAARKSRGASLDGDLFCLLYRHFHADMLTEFVLASVAEATVPGVAALLTETAIGQWAIGRVLKLLPDPCRVSGEQGSESPVAVAHRLAEKGMEQLLSPESGVKGP